MTAQQLRVQGFNALDDLKYGRLTPPDAAIIYGQLLQSFLVFQQTGKVHDSKLVFAPLVLLRAALSSNKATLGLPAHQKPALKAFWQAHREEVMALERASTGLLAPGTVTGAAQKYAKLELALDSTLA